MKNVNKFTSVLNIIIMIVLLSVYYTSHTILEETDDISNNIYISENSSVGVVLLSLVGISKIAIIIGMIISIVINIISSIKNKNNKKLFFSYLGYSIFEIITFIVACGIVEAIAYIIDKYSDIVLPVILDYILIAICIIIAIIQLIFIYKQDESDIRTKRRKIANIILAIFISISVIVNIIFLIINKKEVNEYSSYKQKIKDEIIANFEKNTDCKYILVAEDGKYGYIDTNGKEVIPCMYDKANEFEYLEDGLNVYPLSVVMKDKDYFIISPNQKTINVGDNPVKWMDNIFGELRISIMFKNELKKGEIELNEDNVKVLKLQSEYENSEHLKYRYSNNNLTMEFECVDSTNDKILYSIYNVKVKKKDREEKSYIESVPIKILKNEVKLYSDGYLPFYNDSDNTQGWYDKEGNKYSLKGNYVILEVRNNIMVVKERYTDRVFFVDIKEHKTKLIALKVRICSIGYIVELDNKKMKYLDDNLKQSEEYDYIYKSEIEEDSGKEIINKYWYTNELYYNY